MTNKTIITLHDPELPKVKIVDMPDLGRQFKSFALVDDILLAITGNQGSLACSIRNAVYVMKCNYVQLLCELQQQAKDNPVHMEMFIGKALTNRLINF